MVQFEDCIFVGEGGGYIENYSKYPFLIVSAGKWVTGIILLLPFNIGGFVILWACQRLLGALRIFSDTNTNKTNLKLFSFGEIVLIPMHGAPLTHTITSS